MNRGHAITIDFNEYDEIEVYIDTDDNDIQHVIGINSGFCYASPINPFLWVQKEWGFVLA